MYQDLTSEIISKILDITAFMKTEDYIKMPEKVNIEVFVNLSDKERDIYETLKKDLVVSIKDKDIDAVNAATLSNKLLQMEYSSV